MESDIVNEFEEAIDSSLSSPNATELDPESYYEGLLRREDEYKGWVQQYCQSTIDGYAASMPLPSFPETVEWNRVDTLVKSHISKISLASSSRNCLAVLVSYAETVHELENACQSFENILFEDGVESYQVSAYAAFQVLTTVFSHQEYTATFCKPYNETLPQLEKVQTRLKERVKKCRELLRLKLNRDVETLTCQFNWPPSLSEMQEVAIDPDRRVSESSPFKHFKGFQGDPELHSSLLVLLATLMSLQTVCRRRTFHRLETHFAPKSESESKSKSKSKSSLVRSKEG
mmetsp:Transcript_7502/g.14743  ORF Transcript_7502/g.14743 Transcript_7502/m.14743 type:complete len:288 (+) Transcript_7502:87-950(+)